MFFLLSDGFFCLASGKENLQIAFFFRVTFDGLKRFFTQKWCFCVKIYRIYKTYLYICPQQVVRKCHICT